MQNNENITVVIAAGGTGGHIFPGLAVAEAIKKLHPQTRVIFVGTPRGLESIILPKEGWDLQVIKVPSLKDRRGFAKFFTVLRLPKVLLQAALLLRRHHADLVIGVGGYTSGPMVLMGRCLGIPTAIVEHNAIPGFTNRLLARVAKKIFLSFDDAKRFFPAERVVFSGAPLRERIFQSARAEPPSEKFTIFCFGGSLGAKRLNTAMQEALPHLRDIAPHLAVIHQTGKEEGIDRLRAAYVQAGVEAQVEPFIDDMGKCYAKAHLVVARAGATTVAELAALRKPSILVPYPHAADDHQRANAETLTRIGGAIMLRDEECTGETLASEIRKYDADRNLLQGMEARLQSLPAQNAATTIVEQCWGMVNV
ncbi:MAG: undecaprenyldiphospho-muramoylpentapeptide beta-N-acetylglucosaminyltransferase [Deltaproteobacteria bacterium]|nr:undecaprenyldiphospho-muramoylpentapeptide beta-N-acetylglucosaminyltransferase [Deltaproteobacteria bacterium]